MVEKKTANQKEDEPTSPAEDQIAECQEPEPDQVPAEIQTCILQPIDSFISQMDDSLTTAKNLPLRTPTDASLSVHQRMDMKIFHDLEQLNSMRSSASKDRLMQRLLHKVRRMSMGDVNVSRIMTGRRLTQVTQPKLWRSATGETIQVETAEIEQLRDTRHVYEAICNSTLTEERIRALHLLKRTVKPQVDIITISIAMTVLLPHSLNGRVIISLL